jgi:hypothetical protein
LSKENKLMVVKVKLGTDAVEASPPVELFPLPVSDTGFAPYDVAPDGQRFLVRSAVGNGSQALKMILNWPALLRNGAGQ